MAKEIIKGEILIPGKAGGSLFLIEADGNMPPVNDEGTTERTFSPHSERARFEQEVSALAQEFRQTADDLERESRSNEAEIFRAHAELATDEEFRTRVSQRIQEAEMAAEQALVSVADEVSNMFKKSANSMLAERADDIKDIASQIHRRLAGQGDRSRLDLPASAEKPVVAVQQLYPSVVLAGWNRDVHAFIVESGTAFSHASILAEAFDIPVLRVSSVADLAIHEQGQVYVDATDEGILVIEPGPDEIADIESAAMPEATTRLPGADAIQDLPVRFWINIALPEEVPADNWGCIAGVGLYRTEVALATNRLSPPSEIEQYETYKRLFQSCGDRPVTVRCFDIGGDKPVDFMTFGHNDNPQLGLRSLRVFRYHPELLRNQIKSLARAATAHSTVRLLYPMVETPEQWHFVRELVQNAISEAGKTGENGEPTFAHGFMIETPSTLWCLNELFAESDFASIGTNDLVQYLLGADRTNPDVAHIYRPEHPVVLRVLDRIAKRAREAGKPVTLCGEMAHDPALLPVFVGLGIENLSMPFRLVAPLANQALSLDLAQCKVLAAECLQAPDAVRVRAILHDWHGRSPTFSAAAQNTHTDPVCGMTVKPEETTFFVEEDGEYIYFCSENCLNKYKRGAKNE